MIYIIQLNPSIDRVLEINDFKAGTTQEVHNVKELPRGKGMNVACSLSGMGENVKIFGLMGKSDEERYSCYAEEKNIDCEWILVDESVRRNTTIVDQAKGQVTHLREPGFKVKVGILQELLQKLKNEISKNDWIAFCGSLPQGMASKTYKEMIISCREKTANILLDTSGKALMHGLRGKPFGIKPNLQEFESIFGEQVNGIRHIALKSKSLIDRGISNVFVSLGEEGLLAANHESVLRVMTKPSRVSNVVGCGDAMVAGFLFALHKGLSFQEVCAYGVACGKANTLAEEPGLIKKSQVLKFLQEIQRVKL